MARKIETTVRNAAADLAKAHLPEGTRVTIIVLDDQDEAALDELRRAITEAETTEEVEGDEAFAEIRAHLSRKYPRPS